MELDRMNKGNIAKIINIIDKRLEKRVKDVSLL